jgi:hypothetical protein
LELVIEGRLCRDGDGAGGSAHDPHGRAKDGDRANENECFVVWA